jgi:predicted transcriptional regulator
VRYNSFLGVCKMAKKKKAEPDLLTLAEMARRIGTSRSAVSQWVQSQARADVILAVPMGRRGKMIDINNPIVRRYVQNSAGNSVRAGDGASAENASANTIRKLTYQCKKTELQNTITREKYISLDSVKIFFEKLGEVECEIFSTFPDRVIKRVEAELKLKLPQDTKKKAAELLQTAVGSCLESTYRLIKEFERKNAPKAATKKSA